MPRRGDVIARFDFAVASRFNAIFNLHSHSLRPTPRVGAIRLEPLAESNARAARQNLDRQRRVARGRPIPEACSQQAARDDIRLPVCLALEACDGIVNGQRLEGPNPGFLLVIIDDEWRHKSRLEQALCHAAFSWRRLFMDKYRVTSRGLPP